MHRDIIVIIVQRWVLQVHVRLLGSVNLNFGTALRSVQISKWAQQRCVAVVAVVVARIIRSYFIAAVVLRHVVGSEQLRELVAVGDIGAVCVDDRGRDG